MIQFRRNPSTRSVTATANGKSVEFNLQDLPEDIQTQLVLYGLTSKLRAISAAQESPDKKLEVVEQTWQQLQRGQWRTPRARQSFSELALAIARLKGITPEQAQDLIDRADKEQLRRWRKHPQMQLALAQIRSERDQLPLDF